MKKNSNNGFVLAETLIVTTFVSGILIFLFIQFSNLSKNYNDSYKYNTVEGLYSLNNIIKYINIDEFFYDNLEGLVTTNKYLNITDCSLFSDQEYCTLLFELENIDSIYIVENYFNKNIFNDSKETIKNFINKISGDGEEKYRIVAEFKDFTFATIRFGD